MLELVFDKNLRNFDGGRGHRVLYRLVGCFIARLVECGVRELVADGLSQGGEIRDTDRLRELIVERRKDLLRDLRRPDAERPGFASKLAFARIVGKCELHLRSEERRGGK